MTQAKQIGLAKQNRSKLKADAVAVLPPGRSFLSLLLILVFACTYSWTQDAPAEKPAPPASAPKSAPKTKTLHKRQTKAQLEAEEEKQRLTAPIAPPPDPGPTFPADEKAKKPEISWNSNGLRVEATNSSLKEILAEVSAETGVTVEGLVADQRIYGVYGPGKARQVLGQLLEGTGYNVLMIGDQGSGTPREVVLTMRGANSGKVETFNNQRMVQPAEDDDVMETPDDSDAQQPLRPGFRNSARPMPHVDPQGQQGIQPQNGQQQPGQAPQP